MAHGTAGRWSALLTVACSAPERSTTPPPRGEPSTDVAAPAEPAAPPPTSAGKARPTVVAKADKRPEPAAPKCAAAVAPADRRERDLFVPARPKSNPSGFVTGARRKGDARVWVGPPVPPTVPLHVGDAELAELHRIGSEVMTVHQPPLSPDVCPVLSKTSVSSTTGTSSSPRSATATCTTS